MALPNGGGDQFDETERGHTVRGFTTDGAADRLTARYDRAGARTQDLRIKSPLLYQLSYPVGTGKGRQGNGREQAHDPDHLHTP